MIKSYLHSTSRLEYQVKLLLDDHSLQIHLNDNYSLQSWHSQFSPIYIEEIALKTGHPLSFNCFNQLLIAGFEKKDISCFIDVLSSLDLFKLKLKKSSEEIKIPQNLPNKRFVIVTKMQNQQRIYYPLPLNEIKQTFTIQRLRNIYQNLVNAPKNQNESFSMSFKQGSKPRTIEIDQLKSQNEILKSKLKRLQQKETLDIEQERQKARDKLKTMQQKYVQEIKCLERRQYQLVIELEAFRQDLRNLRGKLIKDDPKVHKQHQQNQRQLEKHKKEVHKNQRQIERFKTEAEKAKKKQKDQALRLKQLQAQLDAVRKSSKGRSYAAYSNSGKNYSIGSKKSFNSKGSSKGQWSK